MNQFIEISKIILPSCITGIITFLITKYNCQRNIPLDKYNFAYNRVYYPIYCLLINETPVQELIIKSKLYLHKYNKYIDKSTLLAFLYLENNSYKRKAQKNFSDNILHMNSKLRLRLGYLEPNIFKIYTYSSPTDKRLVRIIFELMFAYLSLIAFVVLNIKILKEIFAIIFGVFFIALIIEIGIILLLFIKKQFSNLISWLKNFYKRR